MHAWPSNLSDAESIASRLPAAAAGPGGIGVLGNITWAYVMDDEAANWDVSPSAEGLA